MTHWVTFKMLSYQRWEEKHKIQGDPTRLSIVISLWQVSNSQKMAKPNHFWKWYIGRFWYFDVSKVPGEFFLPFKVLSKWWLGSILTQSYMEKRISCCLSVPVGVYFCLIQLCKWIGICGNILGYKDMFQWVLDAQWCWGVCLRAHSMCDPVWLETNQPIWHNIERRDCFLLVLSRHQNIKISQCIISKNGWVL